MGRRRGAVWRSILVLVLVLVWRWMMVGLGFGFGFDVGHLWRVSLVEGVAIVA